MLATRMRMAAGGGSAAWDGTLYDAGEEYTDITGGWVAGYTENANYSQSKEADHLYLKQGAAGGSNKIGYRTYVTENAIDLTDWNTIKSEWEGNRASSWTNNRASFVVSTNKTANYTTNNGITERVNQVFATTTDSIDISALSGNHYVRVHVRGATNSVGTQYWTEAKAYKIWLE